MKTDNENAGRPLKWLTKLQNIPFKNNIKLNFNFPGYFVLTTQYEFYIKALEVFWLSLKR